MALDWPSSSESGLGAGTGVGLGLGFAAGAGFARERRGREKRNEAVRKCIVEIGFGEDEVLRQEVCLFFLLEECAYSDKNMIKTGWACGE